jgi:hypothetical protein
LKGGGSGINPFGRRGDGVLDIRPKGFLFGQLDSWCLAYLGLFLDTSFLPFVSLTILPQTVLFYLYGFLAVVYRRQCVWFM